MPVEGATQAPIITMEKTQKNQRWSISKSIDYYNIDHWGAGYFGVNPKGRMCVLPHGENGPSIDFLDVIDEIHDKDLALPCLVRFQDILRHRVKTLLSAFETSIKKWEYNGRYFGVYPIKVNQMREVVEEIVDAGEDSAFGLEAGSKGELLSVLAYNTNPDALTICNGYKDEDFMRLALMGRKMGRKVIVVIERLQELPLILKIANEMKVEPMIGLRAKLSTPGSGKWNTSSGDNAKFGLTTPEIIEALRYLKQQKKDKCLKLFHFHAGSQLTSIRTVIDALNEAIRMYAKISKMGFFIEYFDVGGGLGIDYEGTKTSNESSINYTLEEYVADVVYTLKQICKEENVPEPHIVSESGRALTAHHSCLILPIFGNTHLGMPSDKLKPVPGESASVVDMREIILGLTKEKIQETFHDATARKEEALSMFKLGMLSLEDRAKIEALYWQLCRKITEMNSKLKNIPEETKNLDEKIADQYLANFSLFQTAPDHWAFGQLFPVAPLHRLEEKPTKKTTIVDLTCDSDGKIDQFVASPKPRSTLKLHDLKKDKPYYLGIFLLGAYQDIMGDMHNLFGRVNEVHVFCDDEDPEDFYLEEVIPGDSIADVLERLQYTPGEMVKMVKKEMDKKVKENLLKPKEGVWLVDYYEKVMKSYTYLSIE